MSSQILTFVSTPLQLIPNRHCTNLRSNSNSKYSNRIRITAVIPSNKRKQISINNKNNNNTNTSIPSNTTERSISENSEEDELLYDEKRLKQEHLNAYFSANDSWYQPRLASAPILALRNFITELEELQLSLRRAIGLYPPLRFTPPDVLNFQLSAESVANREREREEQQKEQKTSWFVNFVYKAMCACLDIRFKDRPIPRFWVLETVARMPYFAYTSCLHLLSTLGWFRSPTLMNMHHAEELNEAYHLAVMESLGGDKRWSDRFIAFHASLLYYWCLVVLFFISPAQSYQFSELLEAHAVDTYAEFIEANRETLKSLPAPDIAYEYYENFMYYFYEFQLSTTKQPTVTARRPQIESLLDVFENILLDEIEHTRTMGACMRFIEKGEKIWFNGNCVSSGSRTVTVIPPREREKFWENWTKLQDKNNEED